MFYPAAGSDADQTAQYRLLFTGQRHACCGTACVFTTLVPPQEIQEKKKKKKACKKARAGVFCSSVLAMLAADILRRSHSFLCWPCQILIILFASAPSSQMLRLLLPSSKTLHLFKGLGCLPASCVLSQPSSFNFAWHLAFLRAGFLSCFSAHSSVTFDITLQPVPCWTGKGGVKSSGQVCSLSLLQDASSVTSIPPPITSVKSKLAALL